MALDSGKGQIAVEVIVRDHERCIFAAKSMIKLAILEPIAPEALAALYAAEFSREFGLWSIIMEGDAVQVIYAVKAMKQNWSRYE